LANSGEKRQNSGPVRPAVEGESGPHRVDVGPQGVDKPDSKHAVLTERKGQKQKMLASAEKKKKQLRSSLRDTPGGKKPKGLPVVGGCANTKKPHTKKKKKTKTTQQKKKKKKKKKKQKTKKHPKKKTNQKKQKKKKKKKKKKKHHVQKPITFPYFRNGRPGPV